MGAFKDFLTNTTKMLSDLGAILSKSGMHSFHSSPGSQLWYGGEHDKAKTYVKITNFLKSRVGEPTTSQHFFNDRKEEMTNSVWLVTEDVAICVIFNPKAPKPELEVVEIRSR